MIFNNDKIKIIIITKNNDNNNNNEINDINNINKSVAPFSLSQAGILNWTFDLENIVFQHFFCHIGVMTTSYW